VVGAAVRTTPARPPPSRGCSPSSCGFWEQTIPPLSRPITISRSGGSGWGSAAAVITFEQLLTDLLRVLGAAHPRHPQHPGRRRPITG
jgi:hypothetical protein